MYETHSLQRARNLLLAFAITLVAAVGMFGVMAAHASAANNDVVVFDIDGTLTDDAVSIWPHPDAANAVKAYKAKGYAVVYLTAQPEAIFSLYTRGWLAVNGFPSAPLYMAPTLLLTDSATVNYKTKTLAKIEQGSPEVKYAYGDSTTDFQAYSNAGVPKSNVFALKRNSASTCQSGTYSVCMNDYSAHLSFINSLPAGS